MRFGKENRGAGHGKNTHDQPELIVTLYIPFSF